MLHTKSAEYEKPRNCSCMSCESTIDFVSVSAHKDKSEIRNKGRTALYRRQDRRDTREFLVEIARVGPILDDGLEWWLDPLLIDVLPINILEESMAHNFLCVGGAGAEPQLWLAGK